MNYRIAPLFCRPWTLNGITPRLIESHYENDYGGALNRLNEIAEELAALDPAKTSAPAVSVGVGESPPINVVNMPLGTSSHKACRNYGPAIKAALIVECLVDPHTAAVVSADEWAHPYSRELAAYPLKSLHEGKYWVPVGRADNVYGDRNLFCSCVPLEEYAA